MCRCRRCKCDFQYTKLNSNIFLRLVPTLTVDCSFSTSSHSQIVISFNYVHFSGFFGFWFLVLFWDSGTFFQENVRLFWGIQTKKKKKLVQSCSCGNNGIENPNRFLYTQMIKQIPCHSMSPYAELENFFSSKFMICNTISTRHQNKYYTAL